MPRKMLGIDGIPLQQVLTTCALTLPRFDPRSFKDEPTDASAGSSSSPSSPRTLSPSSTATPSVSFPLTAHHLTQLLPLQSMVLQFDQARAPLQSERILVEWLDHSDVLIGQNIAYDLMVLRAHSPRLRIALSGRHALVDLSVLNFLHSELRPEKSLKDLGRILGTHLYPDDEKSRRYPSPSSRLLHEYNASDTHNALLSVVALSRRILAEFPHTDKLSPFCLRFYSDLIWSVVRMTESGVPYSLSRLHSLFTSLHHKASYADRLCAARSLLLDSHNSQIPGVQKSQDTFLNSLFSLSPSAPVSFTPKTKKLALTDSNRTILGASLPPSSPHHATLRAWSIFKRSQKLLSTYLYPILLHKRKDTSARSSLLLSSTDPPTPPPPPPIPEEPSWIQSLIPTRPHPRKKKSPPSSPPSLPSSETPSAPPSAPSSSPPPASSASPPSTSTPPPPSAPSTTGGGRPTSSTACSSTTASSTGATPSSISVSSSPTTSSRTPHDTHPETTALLAEPTPDLRRPRTLGGTEVKPSPPEVHLSGGKDQARTTDIYIAYPSWFITPSPFKDNSDSEGGTLQSRITCKDPPEQTAPDVIQDCRRSRFGPSGVLLSMDLAQIELCVPALLSGEPNLVVPITNDDDLHTLRAIATFGADYLKGKYPELASVPFNLWKKVCKAFAKLERQVGKRINFADLFRAGWEKIRNSVYDDIGIWVDPSIFQFAVSNRPVDRPLLWEWQERLIADAHRDGFLSLPFTGQSRTFLGGDKFDVNEIVNFPVQTTASNVLLCIQQFISARLPPLQLHTSMHHTHLCCNTYDALLFDTHRSNLPALRSLIAESLSFVQTRGYWHLLQSLYSRTVPLRYELKEIT